MLLNYETNQTKVDPITKEEGGGDSICIKDNVEEVELSDIYISRTFGDEYEAYNACNLMCRQNDLESVKAWSQSPEQTRN